MTQINKDEVLKLALDALQYALPALQDAWYNERQAFRVQDAIAFINLALTPPKPPCRHLRLENDIDPHSNLEHCLDCGKYISKDDKQQSELVSPTDTQINKAAMKLADCMDYPWAQMPEQGKQAMRNHAKAVIEAAS